MNLSSSSRSEKTPRFVFTREKVVSNHLQLSDKQREAIRICYEERRYEELMFDASSKEQQQQAQEKLVSLKLNLMSLPMLESKWSSQHSQTWGKSAASAKKQTLYQCTCGHVGRTVLNSNGREFARSQSFGGTRATSATSSDRRMPYPFTGCLAHVEVTTRVADDKVLKISGMFEHNSGCEEAAMSRLPAVPLHEHVYEVALDQLESGASLTAVQERNQEMIVAKSYRGMAAYIPHTANHRYNLQTSDNATLYHKFSRRLGVNTRKEPQYNVDDWLDPKHKDFKPAIHDAIFYYRARAEKNEHFKVCLATHEMDEAAVKYIHHSQLILDGTFGVCSRRLLLFIAMGVDEDNKGLPVAFFLFSAPTGNRATHAGYNTEILAELFFAWNHHLTNKFKIAFEPYSTLTDTDTKEHGAILTVWPSMNLLLCKFHLRQCWTNNRRRLRCQGSDGAKGSITLRLFELENRLISSTEYASALVSIQAEQEFFTTLTGNEETRSIAEAALKHTQYLLDHWMPENLWQSWSEWGRRAAAVKIGAPVQNMIPTTNHLESFNCILKRKFIGSWLRSGKRLRIDLLIFILVTRILPNIFARHHTRLQHRVWLADRFRQPAHGADLVKNLQRNSGALTSSTDQHVVAWWPSDDDRQNSALDLASKGALVSLTRPDANSYQASCTSSRNSDVLYAVSIQRSGHASCSCPDFLKNGRACKHLCALRLVVEALVVAGHEQAFFFPANQLEASQIEAVGNPHSFPDHFPLDLPALQAMGADNTTLGDRLGDGALGVDLSEMLDNGDGVKDEGGEFEDVHEEENLSMGLVMSRAHLVEAAIALHTQANQQASVEQQRHSKLHIELGSLLPRFHGIDNLLSDILSLPTDSSQLDELYTVTQSITQRISTVRAHMSDENSSNVQSAESSSLACLLNGLENRECRTPPPKRQRRTLLQPSPEKTQVRKSSNGTL
ncbi:hypothetical protein C8R42DRAFT_724462 [Lentinula raphanica]|nr:hypothetical protein C8R42DRAFT_724462 [Lentinula raphanica]